MGPVKRQDGGSSIGVIVIMLFMAGMLPTLVKSVKEKRDLRDRASDKLPGRDPYILEVNQVDEMATLYGSVQVKEKCVLINLKEGCFCLMSNQCLSKNCVDWYCEDESVK
ncbi:MAG: hypothetical protein ACOX6N_00665 [Patescibacteria group bacterium]|jgi:hypothetical protein